MEWMFFALGVLSTLILVRGFCLKTLKDATRSYEKANKLLEEANAILDAVND